MELIAYHRIPLKNGPLKMASVMRTCPVEKNRRGGRQRKEKLCIYKRTSGPHQLRPCSPSYPFIDFLHHYAQEKFMACP